MPEKVQANDVCGPSKQSLSSLYCLVATANNFMVPTVHWAHRHRNIRWYVKQKVLACLNMNIYRTLQKTGLIYDFAGPYHIGKEHMAFGAPTRYIQLDPSLVSTCDWNQGIERGNREYSQRMHNICCDNCHSHVARCLNEMGYQSSSFGMVQIGVWFFFSGKFTGFSAVLKTYLPFLVLACLFWYLLHGLQ